MRSNTEIVKYMQEHIDLDITDDEAKLIKSLSEPSWEVIERYDESQDRLIDTYNQYVGLLNHKEQGTPVKYTQIHQARIHMLDAEENSTQVDRTVWTHFTTEKALQIENMSWALIMRVRSGEIIPVEDPITNIVKTETIL